MNTGLPNLSHLRILSGLTQKQLGVQLGVTDRTVLRWENGQSDPVLADLRKIAVFFGVSVAYLIGESNDSGQRPPRPSPD